jgi:cysteine desulfurase / selenocysteine lyase
VTSRTTPADDWGRGTEVTGRAVRGGGGVGAYLDYAGIGVVRERARAAMRTVVDEVLPAGSVEYAQFFAARKASRQAAAQLLDCGTDEIALVPNTSTALHLVADGLDWRPGDEVVVFDRDFPANVHPWRRLTDRGVVLRWVPMRDGGYLLEDVAATVGPATRLVAVSQVNFRTGFRIDLDAVCSIAADAGALVCVDAVQGLGVLPLSMSRTPVDFLAAGAHKWLCAPPGTGLFYCRRDRLDLLNGAQAGWFGYENVEKVLSPAGEFDYDLALRPSAARFEGGMPNFVGYAGLAPALEELNSVGLTRVANRVRLLTFRIRMELEDLGYRIESPAGDETWSGIVGFRHSTRPIIEIQTALAGGGCRVSCIAGTLRVAPHYWTSDEELDAFSGVLRAIDQQ